MSKIMEYRNFQAMFRSSPLLFLCILGVGEAVAENRHLICGSVASPAPAFAELKLAMLRYGVMAERIARRYGETRSRITVEAN